MIELSPFASLRLNPIPNENCARATRGHSSPNPNLLVKITPSLRPGLSALLLLSALAALFAPCAARADDDRRVILAVDMTPAGKKLTPPTPDKPVYYLPISNGYVALGRILPFYEKEPAGANDIARALVGSLAKQGYLPATNQSPPSIVLAFRWGTIAPQRIRKEVANADMIHAYTLGDGDVNQYTSVGKELLELKAYHFLIITALDLEAYKQHKEVVLWRAHASTLVWGSYLNQVVGTLITAIAPVAGRETKPGISSTTMIPLGRVIVGEPVVTAPPGTPEKTK